MFVKIENDRDHNLTLSEIRNVIETETINNMKMRIKKWEYQVEQLFLKMIQ